MTAAQATIDEAYAKGELHIDDNGGFEPPMRIRPINLPNRS